MDMINAYVCIHKPVESPEEMQDSIIAALEASGVTGFTVMPRGIDVQGGRFQIEAEETDSNLKTLTIMCGTLNTYSSNPRTPAMETRDAKKAWRIAGQKGKFHKENARPNPYLENLTDE